MQRAPSHTGIPGDGGDDEKSAPSHTGIPGEGGDDDIPEPHRWWICTLCKPRRICFNWICPCGEKFPKDRRTAKGSKFPKDCEGIEVPQGPKSNKGSSSKGSGWSGEDGGRTASPRREQKQGERAKRPRQARGERLRRPHQAKSERLLLQTFRSGEAVAKASEDLDAASGAAYKAKVAATKAEKRSSGSQHSPRPLGIRSP